MNIEERARQLRATIEDLAVALDDEKALDNAELFPAWDINTPYTIGDRVRYEDVLYKCVQDHTSRIDWKPEYAVSLWAKVLIPDPSVIPEWVQPDSTNPYMKGEMVTHNSKTWISDIDYNVFEPGIAGWTEVV